MKTESRRLRARELVLALLAMTVAALMLTGCGSPTQPAAPTPSPPQPLSASPLGDLLYLCLRDLGWDVTIDPDGGVLADSRTIPIEQKPLLDEDTAKCFAEIDAVKVIDDVEKERLYNAELLTRQCLIERGHEIPPAPTLQTYIDTYDTTLWAAWSYLDLRNMDENAYRQLSESCPQPQWSAGVGG